MYFYSEQAIRITYSECVSVALDIRHAMRMRRTVICGLPRSAKFFHFISQRARLKKNIYRKMCFDFLYNVCLRHFSF